MIPGKKIWGPVAGMFVLLSVIVWLDEILDLPSLLLGAPHTPINWHKAFMEMILVAGIGLFVVLRLIRDITSTKQTEEALQLSEEKYRTLIESTLDLVFTVNRRGMFTYINPTFEKVTGYTSSELIGHPFTYIIAPELIESTVNRFRKGIRSDIIPPYESELVHKNETRIPVEFHVTTLYDENGNPTGRFGIGRDISERKKEEEIYRTLANTSRAGVYVVQDGKFQFINHNAAMYAGYTDEEMTGMDTLGIVHPEDRQNAIENAKNMLIGKTTTPYEFRIITKDGQIHWIMETLTSIDYRGKRAILGNSLDVTELRKARRKLEESEKKLSQIVEGSSVPTFVIDNNHTVTHWNRACENLTGVSAHEVIGTGKQWSAFYSKERPVMADLILDNVPAEEVALHYGGKYGKSSVIAGAYEAEDFFSAYGEGGKWLYFTAAPLKDNRGEMIGAIETLQDITKRKQAEEEQKKLEIKLQNARKMEALGTLAGGVAHDLNNVLGGIVSYPELLLMQLPEDSPLRKPISTIQKSGEKAAAIVQDMLTLARRGVDTREVVNLNDIISEQLETPAHEKLKFFHPDVRIVTNLEENLLNIMGSPVHLSKTVMNLISNAAEAMPDGGTIIVSTQNRYIDNPVKGYDDISEGDYVTLTVSDTGIGIPAEDIERIFEPFYTKKVMGRSGTGLGMTVVWGTVKDHNGYIDVQSTEGKGTTFILSFPVTRKKSARDETRLSIEDYTGRGEAILVVDDVEEQRKIASGMLKKLGYSVTTVSSGEEAVEYMKDHSADLLVLDMIMDPGIDGLETYKRILKLHPGQKAIIASGFSESKRVKEAQKLGAGAYVRKPYLMEKIGVAVRNELDR